MYLIIVLIWIIIGLILALLISNNKYEIIFCVILAPFFVIFFIYKTILEILFTIQFKSYLKNNYQIGDLVRVKKDGAVFKITDIKFDELDVRIQLSHSGIWYGSKVFNKMFSKVEGK